jgi:hypothetical protein
MPSPEIVLEGLTSIARDAISVAVVWHAVLAVVLVALAFGWRPSRRLAASICAVPLGSVSVLAALHSNPFNTAVAGVGAIALMTLGLALPKTAVRRTSVPVAALALSLVAFSWVYPHFLEDRSVLVYLYAAPLGLLPCPTLSAVIGLALLARGFESRSWSTVLAGLGLAYGVYGSLRLGVAIDGVLVAGALTLLRTVWWSR